MSEPPHIPEELIELKAHQIWEKRQIDRTEGTPQSDWEEAIYKTNKWYEKNLTTVIIIKKEPDNTNYIEKLKKDIVSDPKELPDCSRWENSK